MSYSLNGKFYKDLDGKDVCNQSIILKPFAAKILVLQSKTDCPLQTGNQFSNGANLKSDLLISPNPAAKNEIVRFSRTISFPIQCNGTINKYL